MALRATAEAVEAMAQISQGIEAFSAAKSATDAGLAMAQIYDALPHDDMSIDAIGSEFFPAEDRLKAFRVLAMRREESGLWSGENVASYKALRAELDPLHVTDLQGYLSFAGILGGALYVAGLAVQQNLPEIFPAFYVFLVTCFAAPFAYAFFLA